MGIITITYRRDGQEVDPNNLNWDTRLDRLQNKYQILNQLEVEDDIQITFDLDGQLEEIDWQSTEVTDPELIKKIIEEYERYNDLYRRLSTIS